MKINHPVTGIENDYPEPKVIVSNTDLKGAISHVNRDFIEISGFSEDELQHKNHNIVRHPDMPPAAFADLWETMKRDEPWIGIVKNRCKNGDHYWVEAYSAPIKENGSVIGYQSVRAKPTRVLVNRAEKIYRAVNAGKVNQRTFTSIGHANKIFLGSAFAITVTFASALAAPSFGMLAPIAGLLMGLVAAFFASRLIAAPLVNLARESQKIVNNPIARLVFSGRTDEIGQLKVALCMQRAKLRTVLGRTIDAAGNLTDVASETASAADQTHSALAQQRSETDQVVTAITEMAATVREVAKNTAEAAHAATQANTETQNINVLITQTIAAINNLETEINNASEVIHKLDEESNSIGRVLEVIRGIAEQTNLLALNAAIEAARAGEAGRGFAVVADEVRTLASRTAQSTQEIDDMIRRLRTGADNAVKAMDRAKNCADQSVEQVGNTAESLSAITQSVIVINEMNTQIATASEEQTAVAEEVNRNIHSISSSAEQTEEGARRVLSASKEVARMASELTKVVHQCEI